MINEKSSAYSTRILISLMGDILDSGSQAVLDFLDTSFIITDQMSKPILLQWPEELDILLKEVSTCYLTQNYLQTLV